MEPRLKRIAFMMLACMMLSACVAVETLPPNDSTKVIDVAAWREMNLGAAVQCWEECECAVFLCGDGVCGFQARCQSEEVLEGQILLALRTYRMHRGLPTGRAVV